jgi:hypothetical protein
MVDAKFVEGGTSIHTYLEGWMRPAQPLSSAMVAVDAALRVSANATRCRTGWSTISTRCRLGVGGCECRGPTPSGRCSATRSASLRRRLATVAGEGTFVDAERARASCIPVARSGRRRGSASSRLPTVADQLGDADAAQFAPTEIVPGFWMRPVLASAARRRNAAWIDLDPGMASGPTRIPTTLHVPALDRATPRARLARAGVACSTTVAGSGILGSRRRAPRWRDGGRRSRHRPAGDRGDAGGRGRERRRGSDRSTAMRRAAAIRWCWPTSWPRR